MLTSEGVGNMRKKGIIASVICFLLMSTLPLNDASAEGNDGERQTVPLPTLQSEYPGVVFVKGDPTTKQVALTFDDGPDPRFTGQVLDKLEAHDVPATFFVLGMRVNSNPELLTRINNLGHEVGNHTFSHPNLTDASVDQLVQEVMDTEQAVEAVIGYRPRLFRPPYGFITRPQVERLGELDNSIIGWNVDTNDWQGTPAEEVAQTVLQTTTAGSIILMHDGGDVDTANPEIYSADALDEIIPALQGEGYTFVTVSELLGVPRAK